MTEKKCYRKKGTVVWPAMFFVRVQITTGKNYDLKKKVQLSGRRLKLISDNRLSCQNMNTNYYKTGKNYNPKKKRYSRLVVAWSTKHKTQHTQTQQPTR
jgi:hypothetical protein